MIQQKTHDLYDFMRQISAEMSAEYNRIQMRATEDPGTAGDQGEENWAELLRDWLPRNYEVVTKGRIISQEGITSPQIDLLVLNGAYPKKLITKKLYLAAGVAAAFECKVTLKASHIEGAVKNSAIIKSLYPNRVGTPYKELHSPLIYGLLAHSHAWKGGKSMPAKYVEQKLNESDSQHISHPRLQLDLLCIADLASWTSAKMAMAREPLGWCPKGMAATGYMCHAQDERQAEHFTPIGVLVSYLSRKLAWENRSLRDLADYYRVSNLSGFGCGFMRTWPSSIYSEDIRPRLEAGEHSTRIFWDEWAVSFQPE